ncbi:hypothetical protein O0I10_000696 [Lichtheimia ornata]|uniref:Protein-S-isoprenylcysteine O-methyltransferase n=1 Tax=Lichtheimia ornata TaxID=688661 RepID=A0AAD7Y473_9FUNG|nr:uncharacterized protein O0I10_000696 [Lichtheimia ornata]KAJ8663456.1 hypothetical protein O0I10_000696 [Lichtheimia ornata]
MDSDSSSTDTEEFEAQRRIDQRITFRPRPQSNGGGSGRIQISSRPSSIDSRATASSLLRQQQQQQPVLFDGTHTPRNIAAISFLLGLGGGIGVAAAWLSSTPQMGLFLLAVALFHFADYLATSIYQVHKLDLQAYLFMNKQHCYEGYHAIAWLEFAIEYYHFPSLKRIGLLNYMGFGLVVIGLLCRVLAIMSPRYQNASKSAQRPLDTNGIYRMIRHPYFFGLYWWAIGVQITLLNPVGLAIFVFMLHDTLSQRIKLEDQNLQRLYHDIWNNYKAATPTWLPFIP